MRGLKKKRRIQIIALAVVALAGSTALIGYAMQDGINFFRSPSQVMSDPPQAGEVFRIGGLVAEGSVVRGQGDTLAFAVTDGGATVPVTFRGIIPDLFSEGQGTVALGSMQGEVFVATEVLAKHDETYMPTEVIDALKAQGVYVEPKPES
jgi:cytochrome c-type biogenesis protein CcmE